MCVNKVVILGYLSTDRRSSQRHTVSTHSKQIIRLDMPVLNLFILTWCKVSETYMMTDLVDLERQKSRRLLQNGAVR